MNGTLKHSYTVPCSSTFRDAIATLAARRHVNAGDLARSVLLIVPADIVAAQPDPGEPAGNDREQVTLKSGPAQGRPWRRKPRLQVRMPPGHTVPFIRRALALALAIERGEFAVRLDNPKPPTPRPADTPSADEILASRLAELDDELNRLRSLVGVLAFEPLPNGVQSRADALHILGFPPTAQPDPRALRAKFRLLATIHHPDSEFGNHVRMSQLNEAMALLRRSAV